MKYLLTPSRMLALPALLGCAWASAQSLGLPVGQAWIGRPLELTVPARFASSDSRDECVHAEVFYGDNRLRPGQVRATVIGPPQQRRVRVQVDALIDEPVVTLRLRAGCASSITRSYALLPDLPSEAVIAAWTQPAAAVVQGAPAPAAAGSVAAAAPPTGAPAATAAPLRNLRRAAALANPPARSAAARVRTPAQAAGPRLRLEPPSADVRPLLRSTGTLSEAGDGARRATAALLWQAINADPQELVRSTAQLQRLEQELAQLRQGAARMRGEMAALRGQVDAPAAWHASPALLQVLALLVLAAAAAAGVLAWRTRRTATHSWYDPALAAAQQAPAQPPQSAADAGQRALEPTQAAGQAAAPAAARAVAAPPPRRGGNGALRVETLAATLEEASFLGSLGLQGHAIQVLASYLEGSSSPSPVACHELMRLRAQAGDPAAVEQAQRLHAQLFGVEAPALEQLTAPAGLEDHPQLCERITRAWPAGKAAEVIEQALFEPAAPAAVPTLQAAGDLVCLHQLAIVLAGEAGPQAQAQPLAPWAHTEDPQEQLDAAAADAAGGRHFALDLDLSVEPHALPEVRVEHRPDPQHLAALLKAEKEAALLAARRKAEEEDAFSAAVASERRPVARL